VQCVPLYVLEELVLLDVGRAVLGAETVALHQQLADEVLALFRHLDML